MFSTGTAFAIEQSIQKGLVPPPSGERTKHPAWHDRSYLELADLNDSEYNDDHSEEWTRNPLIRRNIADPRDRQPCKPGVTAPANRRLHLVMRAMSG